MGGSDLLSYLLNVNIAQNTLTKTSRIMFGLISGHRDPGKLAHKKNHHRWLSTILGPSIPNQQTYRKSKLLFPRIYLPIPRKDLDQALFYPIPSLSPEMPTTGLIGPVKLHEMAKGHCKPFITVLPHYPKPFRRWVVLCKFPSCAQSHFGERYLWLKSVG